MDPDEVAPKAPALPADDSPPQPSDPADTPRTTPAIAPVEDEDPGYAAILMGTHRGVRSGRRALATLPSDPRCKQCAAPFGPPFGLVMRMVGKAPWPKNPKYCAQCYRYLISHRGGAEIPSSFLFADVRGSTSLAEGLRPSEFRALMDRFFEIAAKVLVRHDAIVDKFVGDEVIGIFVPSFAGKQHAAQAIAAGRELLRTMAEREAEIPIGVGVHSGIAYVGTVGEGTHVELTAMGDPVNVTARLASAAGAGEMLVTLDAAAAAGLDPLDLERRDLTLKGKSETTDVFVLTALTGM